MFRKTFTILAVAMAISACNKDDDSVTLQLADCAENNWGTMCIQNSSGDPMDVWVDNIYRWNLSPGQERCVDHLSVGNHGYYAEQSSGFVFSPDTWAGSIDIGQCESHRRTLIP